MKVAVLGCGNVGIAIAADLSIRKHDVSLIKTSGSHNKSYELLLNNHKRVYLKEEGRYTQTIISEVSMNLASIVNSDIVFITIQSSYHEDLIKNISPYLSPRQIVVVVCSYMSSMYFKKHCNKLPYIVETTGPYLEGRVELNDKPGDIVFRVGCRLTRCPLSIYQSKKQEVLEKLKTAYKGFSNDYNPIESALLNPNMVIHTVGSIMSIPRIEYSEGNFCMYREAYSHKNPSTLNIMLALDEEKKSVLKALGCTPVDIFVAGGFLGDPLESFFRYSESEDRAISPTSVKSRYITEDVSQGLVLLESIAKRIGVEVPVTSSLITIASNALDIDFRKIGRTLEKLDSTHYIDSLKI